MKKAAKKAAENMTEAEDDALKILSKMTEAVEAPIATVTREKALGGDSATTFAVAEVVKEKPKKAAKYMTEAEAYALNILSKTTEATEAPMVKERREGALKTIGGVLGDKMVITYAVAEVPKVNSKSLQKI